MGTSNTKGDELCNKPSKEPAHIKSKEENEKEELKDLVDWNEVIMKYFYIDKWVDIIKEFTFRTEMLELSREEAQAIVNFYDYKYFSKENGQFSDKNILLNLQERINNLLENKNLKESGCFVKCSFRSTKEGLPLRGNKVHQYFEEEVLRLNSVWKYEDCLDRVTEEDFQGNIKWISKCRALERLLKCQTAEECLNLILTSSRLYEDMKNVLKYDNLTKDELESVKHTKLDWSIKLFFREFDDGIEGINEYRCFVHKNKLNAITQYNFPLFLPFLQSHENRVKIKNLLVEFWKKNVEHSLSFLENYVVDFAIKNEQDVVIIELNPFVLSCGTGMFNWVKDHDTLYGLIRDPEKSDLENVDFRVHQGELGIAYEYDFENFEKIMLDEYVKATSYIDTLNSLSSA